MISQHQNELDNELDKELYTVIKWENIKSKSNSLSTITKLLNEGANPNLNMHDFLYIRHDASKPFPILSYVITMRIPQEVAVLLIEKGANINQVNMYGEEPLGSACFYNKDKIVDALLKKGVDVNFKRDDGSTALHCAVKGGCNSSIIQMLLDTGINPLIPDNKGKIAKDYIEFLPTETKAVFSIILNFPSSLLGLSFFALSKYQRTGKLSPININTLPSELREKASAFGIKFAREI